MATPTYVLDGPTSLFLANYTEKPPQNTLPGTEWLVNIGGLVK